MFEAGIQASRDKGSPETIPQYEEFVEATNEGLVATILERIISNAMGWTQLKLKNDRIGPLIEDTVVKAIWLETSVEQETRRLFDYYFACNVKLRNERKDELEKMLTSWYRYLCGYIKVSF